MKNRSTKSMLVMIDKAKKSARLETIEAYSAVILLILKDKFEFTPEQLQEVVSYVNDQFDSMALGYFHPNDILVALAEEGVNIGFRK